MREHAEYMELAISANAVADRPDFERRLRANLSVGLNPADKKLARTIQCQYSVAGPFLFVKVLVGSRDLITFQGSAKRRAFFLTALSRISRFMSCYSTDVRIVFFSDTHPRLEAVGKTLVRSAHDFLNTRWLRPGTAVILKRQADFYFCLYNATLNSNGLGSHQAALSFYAHSVVLASGPEEARSLLSEYIEKAGAKLVYIEQVERVAPMAVIPGFDLHQFDWERHRVVYSSGRAFYEDDPGAANNDNKK